MATHVQAPNTAEASTDVIFDNLIKVFTTVKDFKNANITKPISSQDDIHKSGVLNLMHLRQINRVSNMECKHRRDQTQEKKLLIDELYLQYQNLQYEVLHLQKEITNCLEFKSNHEDIQLHSLEEFLIHYPNKKNDSHKLMLSRLEFELKERKRLVSRRKELELSIKVQKDTMNNNDNKLSSLRPSLESLKQSAVGLQQFFSPSLVWEKEQYELALSLPLPLYMLYVQTHGYGKAQDEYIKFAIVGEKDEVQSFKNLLNYEEPDNDDDNKKKKKRKTKSIDEIDPPFCKAFPLSVSLTITNETGSSVTILFSHLSFFNVTCCVVTDISFVNTLQSEASYFIDKTSFLNCLYDNDSGRTSPNVIVSSHIRKYGGDNFSTAVRKYGFPFKWVQRVCGVQSPSDTIDQSIPDNDFAATSIQELINIIRNRLTTQEQLAHQLTCLDQLKLSITSSSKLIRWGQVSLQELNKLSFSGLMKFNFQERVNRFFLATFQNGEARLHCITCITPNYPLMPSVALIMIELSNDKHKEQYTIQLKNIEAEINLMDNTTQLLLDQMRRLSLCFDNYIEWRQKQSPLSIRGPGRLLKFE